MDFQRVADTLSSFFVDRDIPFAVIGGVGLHAYGLSRATFDFDLVTDGERQEEVVEYLESLGYRTLHQSRGYSNHLHAESSWGRVDVVYVRGETRQRIFAAASRREVAPGIELPVPRPEHLAAMKVHALRNDPERALQDLADLRFLVHLPGVDREQVRGFFADRGLLDRYREIVDDEN